MDYGPANPKAFETGVIKAERAAQLPSAPENAAKQAPLRVLRLVVVAGRRGRGEALGRLHAEIVLPASRRGVHLHSAPSQDHSEQPRAGPLGIHQRREQRLMLALALPALLVILLLVVLPVGWLAWQSVYHNGFTLENYRRIWSEDIYWRSFALTFEISLLVTLLALLLGYPIAYAASIAEKVGHHHPGAGGAAILDQRAGPRLCLARAAATDRRHQPAAAPTRRDRRPGPGPQQFSAPSWQPVHILLPFMVLPLARPCRRRSRAI